jgi:acyl-CoA synthetase (NDP forming)
VRVDQLRGAVDGALARGGGWMTPEEAERVLAAAGIVTATTRVVTTTDDAVAAACTMGYPVALKALGPTLLHKTERQAVRLDLADDDAVRRVAREFDEHFHSEMTGMIVQRMVPDGVEMLVGAVHDPSFGPVVVCGSGGVLVDLVADTAFRLHPLTDRDASEMLDELKGARLLRGYRGAPPADEPALRDLILRLSSVLTTCPEIQELDLNPVKVLQSGVRVADARIRVERRPPVARTRRVEY